jgi:hypothetical protein
MLRAFYPYLSQSFALHACTRASPTMAVWTAPRWVHTLYAQFPLVLLDQEDELPRDPGPSMWVRASKQGRATTSCS